jgi:uncharacterized membrane protein YbhN (UPF0104 family)
MLLQINGSLPARDSSHGVISVLAVIGPRAQSIIRGIGRNGAGAAISLSIVAVALATLYHVLRGVDAGKVIAALEGQPTFGILSAAALVVAGYANLIGYDLFALRTIGRRDIPFRIVAFTSFTSYTIGHSLGAATLTCGLLRLRVYSFWDLDVADVAKIAFITGLTYWLGNIFVLGVAASYAPAALGVIDRLPPLINRLFGLAGLLAVACYLVWLAPRSRIVGWNSWRIVLPNLRRSFLQIGIGTADRVLASLSLYMLLPAMPDVGIVTVLAIFVVATLLGTISHAPGSLGIVEAAMLVGLAQYQREELLASLLTFRILDFFLPLLLATVMFGLRELRLAAKRRPIGTPIPPQTL